jgi:hypothetical protein
MPGKNDYVSVRQGDEKIHIRKRLLLASVRECYQTFKQRNSSIQVGFSKFATLRQSIVYPWEAAAPTQYVSAPYTKL